MAEVVSRQEAHPCRPVHERRDTYSAIRSSPLSVISIPVNGCSFQNTSFVGSMSERMRHSSRSFLDQVDAKVHLEPRESLVHALFQALSIDFRILRFGGVAIDAHLVAKLSAEHLIDGNVVGLSCEIPQRHLDAADSAGLSRLRRRTA